MKNMKGSLSANGDGMDDRLPPTNVCESEAGMNAHRRESIAALIRVHLRPFAVLTPLP